MGRGIEFCFVRRRLKPHFPPKKNRRKHISSFHFLSHDSNSYRDVKQIENKNSTVKSSRQHDIGRLGPTIHNTTELIHRFIELQLEFLTWGNYKFKTNMRWQSSQLPGWGLQFWNSEC